MHIWLPHSYRISSSSELCCFVESVRPLFSRAQIIIREPIFLNEWMNPSSASNRFFITAQSWFHIFVRERFTATEWAKRRLDIKLEHHHFYMSRVDHKIKFLVFIKKNISWLFILIITGINNFAASFCPDDRSLSSRWIYKTPSFLWVLTLEGHAAWFMHHSLKSKASLSDIELPILVVS